VGAPALQRAEVHAQELGGGGAAAAAERSAHEALPRGGWRLAGVELARGEERQGGGGLRGVGGGGSDAVRAGHGGQGC
jgi:hypothetical protein